MTSGVTRPAIPLGVATAALAGSLAFGGAVAAPAIAAAPRLASPSVALLADADPLPLGTNLQLFVNNQVNNLLALAPILVGSTKQCAFCIGPYDVGPDWPDYKSITSGFTGWGAIGIANGIIGAPGAFVSKLVLTQDLQLAVAAAMASVVYPTDNTLRLLYGPRDFGGFELDKTLSQYSFAARTAINNVLGTASTVFRNQVNNASSLQAGLTEFTYSLTQGDSLVTAINNGREPIQQQLEDSSKKLTDQITFSRQALNTVLKQAPVQARNPIPTQPLPPGASVNPNPNASAKSAAATAALPTRSTRGKDSKNLAASPAASAAHSKSGASPAKFRAAR